MTKATKNKRKFGNARSGTAAMSLNDIGKRYGVSLQCIQGIEQRALRKIRKAIEEEANRAGCSAIDWLLGNSE